MQEQSFLIQEMLANGLRPDPRMPNNAHFMEEMRNLKPTEMGAVSAEKLVYPIVTPAFSKDWPFPMIMRGESQLYLFDRAGVFTVNEATFATTAIPLFEIDIPANTKTLAVAGTQIHLASFLDSFWSTDGVNLIIDLPGNDSDKTLVYDTAKVKCNTVLNHQNRLFIAGASGTTFAAARFLSVFDHWRDSDIRQNTVTADDELFGTQYIIWSAQGGSDTDTPFELIKRLLMEPGAGTFEDDVTELLRGAVEDGTIGFMPVRETGEIRHLKTIGGNILVYGERGVSILQQDSFTTLGEQVSIGFTEIPIQGSRGVPGRGSVGGDSSEHLMVDNDNDIWMATGDSIPTRLGFKQFISTLTESEITVSFDPQFRDHWIADSSKSYIKSVRGLGGASAYAPSSVVRSPGNADLIATREDVDFNVALTGSPADLDETDVRIMLFRTHQFDMGSRHRKHITGLQVSRFNVANGRASVYYRNDITAFIRHIPTKFFREGIPRMDVSSLDYQLEIYGVSANEDCVFDYVQVRWQPEDRREIRGTTGTRSEA